MIRTASALTAAILLTLIGSSTAKATVRTGMQVNTQLASSAPDTTISTVSAVYDPESGYVELDVTFQAPPQGSKSPTGSEDLWIKAMLSGAASREKCWEEVASTAITAQTNPNGAIFYHAHKIFFGATSSVDGATVSISGTAPELIGLEYRCVTVEVDANANGAAESQHPLSTLTPPLYFTGYAPSPPAPPTPVSATPAPMAPASTRVVQMTPQNGAVHPPKKATRSQLLAAAVKRCMKLKGRRRAACVRAAKRKYGTDRSGRARHTRALKRARA